MTQKNSIPYRRMVTAEKITIIEELIKCLICLEIICKPYKYKNVYFVKIV